MLGVYVDDELDEIAARDVPAGQRAQRMKDVTPKMEYPTFLEVPEMPDTSEAEEKVKTDQKTTSMHQTFSSRSRRG